MVNHEVLEHLGMDETSTVTVLYSGVADRVDVAINGITEAMRNNVFRVRTVKRGASYDLQRTNVRIGGIRYLPFTQDTLVSRWALVGKERLGYQNGTVLYTEEIFAGKTKLVQRSPHALVIARGEDNYGTVQKADFTPNIELGALEPNRKQILLSAASTILSHSVAIEQINSGLDPTAVIATLQNPNVLSLTQIDH